METLGWKVIDVQEGHDLQSVYRAIEQAIATARGNDHQPVLVRVRTVKGYGVKATEENASGGHGFPLKGGEKIVEFVSEICGGEVPEALMTWAQELRSQWEAQEAAKAAAKGTSPSVKKDKIQSGLAQAAIQAAQEGIRSFRFQVMSRDRQELLPSQKSFP